MTFHGLGTIVNVLTIVIGGGVGLLVGRRFADALRGLFMDALGLITMISAVSSTARIGDHALVTALPSGGPMIVVLASMLIGGGLGYALRIEDRLEHAGEWLRRRFAGDCAGDSGRFVEGFVMASLIFVIGPLAILGAISDGLGTGIDQLLLKASLDGIASVAFASALGPGVIAAALPVGIYQGLWTVVGALLGSIMNPAEIAAMTATGGLLLAGISLKLLDIKHIRVGSFLPALFVAPVLVALVGA